MLTSQPEKLPLSIIVIFHNMRREAARTLYTLSTAYQSGVSANDYEIIAIDNGSTQPLNPDHLNEFGCNIKYHFFKTESLSPVGAVNYGVDSAKGKFVAIIIDGARMVTPGLISKSLQAMQLFENPFACALGWHLGPDVQGLAIAKGYNKLAENTLLESIDWRHNGYRLFEISTLAPSSNVGFLGGMPYECSWLAMPRATFLNMNGFDNRFQEPGGGLVNHDFLERVLLQTDIQPIVILGEGSFHQIHGGIATNSKPGEHPWPKFNQEYMSIHGKPYASKLYLNPFYLGDMPTASLSFVKGGAISSA